MLDEAPGVFAPVAAHPATETALVAAYRELRDCSEAALDAVAGNGDRAADVVRIHRAARARLETDWYDEEDLITGAVATLAEQPSGSDPLGLGAVVVYLPQRLSRHVIELLAALAAAAPLAVIAGATGDERADAEVMASVAQLAHRCGAEITASLTSPLPPVQVDAQRTLLVTCSDADDEVRAALGAVVDAARAGTPFDRVAVLYAEAEPYARLVHEQFEAAGIPLNGSAVMPVAARVAGRTLLDLLALPEGGFRRQDVFAWLASAPLPAFGAPNRHSRCGTPS